jgi:hypothetical protein
MSSDKNNIWAGNPHLNPAHSYNHDAIITFHSNSLGLFSIGGFYKTIKSFTYSTNYNLYQSAPAGLDSIGSYADMVTPNSGATLYTFVNSKYDATVKGFEADFQTRLWYLPVPFDGIVLGINYTHIWSEATYPFYQARTSGTRQTGIITTIFDSTRTGRLVNQPNDIMNSYVGYDYRGFSGRVSFLFQGNSVSGIGNYPEQDGFTDNYFRIDASVKQVLPWWNLQVFLDINNLNSAKIISRQKSIGGFTAESLYGLTANLGIRHTF